MGLSASLREFFLFGIKQARASVFAGSFLALLLITSWLEIPGPLRSDLLFLGALIIQGLLIATKLETVDEAKVILLFHLIGLVLELYKTSPEIGSWTYPEPGHFRVMNVPLYSGFMYAAVGSYIAQAWKVFQLRLVGAPPFRYTVPLGALIYVNFFTNHYVYDVRWFLALAVLFVFRKTWVEFTVTKRVYRMPLVLSFVLIAFFIWVAENIGTYANAWRYPHQARVWEVVSFHKVSSWSLLVILSFLIIAYLKHVKEQKKLL